MHTIKITHNLLFEYQTAESNRIEKKSIRYRESNRIETFLPELECSNMYVSLRISYHEIKPHHQTYWLTAGNRPKQESLVR